MENLITVNEDFLARHCDQFGACLGLSPASDLDPSDIVQATLVKAYPASARFQGRTKPKQVAWLRTILSTTVANALRWRGHREVERSIVSGTGSDGSFTFTDQGPADGRPGPEDVVCFERAVARTEASHDPTRGRPAIRCRAQAPSGAHDRRDMLEDRSLQAVCGGRVVQRNGKLCAFGLGKPDLRPATKPMGSCPGAELAQ